jgi:hypothetical protein
MVVRGFSHGSDHAMVPDDPPAVAYHAQGLTTAAGLADLSARRIRSLRYDYILSEGITINKLRENKR